MTEPTTELATREDAGLLDLAPAIAAAVQLGPDGVATLKELEAMQIRAEERHAVRAFNDAVAELHRRVGSIPKNRTANFKTRGGASVTYRYADLHMVATKLREHTGELGLSWKWDTEYADGAEIVTCTASHRAGHRESATWRAPIEGGNPMTSAPQKAKIATTFAQRVTLIQVFGLTDTEDDTDAHMPADEGPDAPPPETITEEQAANFRALLTEMGRTEEQVLQWAKVERLEDLSIAAHKKALDALEASR